MGREARPFLITGPVAGVDDFYRLNACFTRDRCDDTSNVARRGAAQGGAGLGHVKAMMWERMPPTDCA